MSDADLRSSLQDLVEEHAGNVFGLPPDELHLEQLALSRPLHRKPDRYHRVLTMRYSSAGEVRHKRVWLKFLTHVRARYEIHMTAWHRTREVCDLFPRPYFYREWNGSGLIGMELVEGVPLRGLFLRRAFLRRSADLDGVFAALGRSLRAFHDSSEPIGFRSLGDLSESARRVASQSEYLRGREREQALDRIALAAARAGGAEIQLPLIPVHHDCSLRNVLVRRDGGPCLLDLDSMRAPCKSRWYDVAGFLINLESQSKYSPLGRDASIAAAWESFWSGYAGAGLPDGLSLDQVHAVLLLIKVEYLFGAMWRSLFDVYSGLLASRYPRRLRSAVLSGEPLIFAKRSSHAA